ncbi:MAG: hypothetical protein K6G61_03350 [Solobacterium sp.]|nr:hypothetical protein [Solobacterium sp.]
MFETMRQEFRDIAEHLFETGIVINDSMGNTKTEVPFIVFTAVIALMIHISFRLFIIICAVFTLLQAHCFLRKHTGEMIDISPAELFRILTEALTQ